MANQRPSREMKRPVFGFLKMAPSVLMTIISMLGALLVYGPVAVSGPAVAIGSLVLSGDLLSVYGAKVFLANTAEGTNPVVGDVLKCSTRFDTIVGVAYGRVVDVPAHIAYILLHCLIGLLSSARNHSRAVRSPLAPS